MTKAVFVLALLVGLLSLAWQSHAAPDCRSTTRAFVYVANDVQVGHMTVARCGQTYDVEYYVDDNGRGPKYHETVRLSPVGIPLAWTVDGTSLMGARVAERFHWADGKASWKSQAGSGQAVTAKPKLYIANDSSPWAWWVYANALLANDDGRLDLLPDGQAWLERVARLSLTPAGDGPAVESQIVRISGVAMRSHYLLLGPEKRLLATVSDSGVMILEKFRDQVQRLRDAVKSYRVEHAADMQQQLAHATGAGLWLRDVHVFDPVTGTRSGLVNIHVKNGYIVSVDGGWKPQPDEMVFDGAGGTVIPGLHDMHSHSTLLSGLWYLAAGVTSTRDMGNDNSFLTELVKGIRSGKLAGPRITRAGFIEGQSDYSAHSGFVVDSLAEGLDAVQWYHQHGYRQIKIYNSMNPDWVAPMAARAHALGMTVVGHIPAFTNADEMIRAGYDGIAHINQLMLGWLLSPEEDTRTPLRLTAMKRAASLDLDSQAVQDTIELMQKRGVALNTTAVILERLMLSRAGKVLAADKPYLSHMPIAYRRYRRRTYVPDLTPTSDAKYQQAFAKVLQLIGRLHRQGVTLLPGTDDTTGFTVHRELELYVKAGLSPQQALRAATWQCEVYLGRTDKLGRIKPGHVADLVLLPGDPTIDIRAIRWPSLVIKGKQMYFPAEIYAALGVSPFSQPPTKLQ